MISKLDHTDNINAKQIHKVFQLSYAIEAKILQATDFPPLKRTLEEYIRVNTVFYGYWSNKNLAGVVELRITSQQMHIQSLVVHPDYFRQGIASKLMKFVIELSKSKKTYVETGVDNIPAIKLYEKFGFKQVNEWDTDCGIRKVRLEESSSSL